MLDQWFQGAAQTILEQCAASQIELVDTVVLVPNFHAGAELNRALLATSSQPVLLVPQVLTFPAWAANVQCGGRIMPNSRRTSLLYHALKARAWFDPALLWTMCDEIGHLFDELTYQAVVLPLDKDEFAAQVSAYYQVQRHTAVEFEARLVHELWFALSRHDLEQGDLSPAAFYALQLAQLAQAAAAPLFVLGLSSLTRLEQNCLDQYAQRQRVTYIAAVEENEIARTLHAAWPKDLATPLAQRARDWADRLPRSPMLGRVSYCGTYSLEEEASAADTQVRWWLAEGKQSIALVVQDRMTARRLRALLERAQILVADETGWSLDTTRASTIVMRWLEALLADFPYQDVIDLLKSSYLFADWEGPQREAAAWQIEQTLRNHGPVQGCMGMLAVLRRRMDTDDAIAAVSRLQLAAVRMGKHMLPLGSWLEQVEGSLTDLGIITRLAADAAGLQLLGLLARRRHELAGDESKFSLAEFHRWLGRELESGAFVDTDVVSPVVFTHLAATRLRNFDAALILGADAMHLPSLSSHSVFFNQAVRTALGLPAHADEIAQIQGDLLQLLSHIAPVQVLWRMYRDGETNAISPWLERLDSFHQLAWGASLNDNRLRETIPAAQIITADALTLPQTGGMPQPRLPAPLIPGQISVTGYNTLLACPYQYYARQVLGLNELDDIRAEMEKTDYGQAVHAILLEFHASHPRVSDEAYDTSIADLTRISLRLFQPMLEEDYYVHAWQQRWLAKIPLYLDWQIEREQTGWQWHSGEVAQRLEFMLDPQHAIALYGRLDRIDKKGDTYAVLDYKTSNNQGLKNKIKQIDEDVQLPAYALLMQAEVGETAFVSLDGDSVSTIGLPDGVVADAAASCGERLVTLFRQLHQHAPMPANGIDEVCQHCNVRGLCRRDHWVTEH
ncbi:MAG: PD-(D/E)XK nuclease family protein [Sulfuriferula sp.]